jgi:hypothetical protein
MRIIKQQRQLGFDILESIQIVVRLHKVMDFKNMIKKTLIKMKNEISIQSFLDQYLSYMTMLSLRLFAIELF